MPPAILAIDTSGLSGTVALRRGGELVEERELERLKRRHAQTLIPEVHSLLAGHQLAPTEIDVVGVSQGPGSFTGLRVGVVFAKTFAFATGCRLVAVDTLAAVADSVPDEADGDIRSLSIISDAQREQLFVEDFDRHRGDAGEPGVWQSTGPIRIVDIDEWVAEASRQTDESFAVGGPALTKLSPELPDSIRQLPEAKWTPRAAQVARLTERKADAGEFADPVGLEPFYLRKSAAEEKREARQTRTSST